jgi:hypothetical protein
MSKTLAIVLSIVGGLFLLGIIAVGSGAYLVYKAKDKLIRTAEDNNRRTVEELRKHAEEARTRQEGLRRELNDLRNIGKESEKFGAKTNNEGCLQEAMSRHKHDKSITGRGSTQGFLTACLQASEPSPGFCEGVPPRNEIMKSANWALKKCADAGLQDDQGCQQIFGAVQTYCHRSK